MMRGSVVLLAVFAVSSYSIGANGAHFIKSGIRGDGTERGNEAPGIGESGFGNGENDGRGHSIGKRSLLGLNLVGNLGHDIARLAGFRSAAARRQQMISPKAQFSRSIPPPAPIHTKPWPYPPPAPIHTEPWPYPLPGPIHTKPWPPQSDELQSKPEMPSVSGLRGEIQPLPTMKFLPLSGVKDKAIKIISKLLPGSHVLPGILPAPLARSSSARRQNVYRSDLKNRRSRYSGLRSDSPLPSYPSLPSPPVDDFIIPLYKHVRNMAPAQLGTELNFREDLRSVLNRNLAQLWDKISKWFKPGGKDLPSFFPNEEIPIEGGQVPVGDLLTEDDIHSEHIPAEDTEVGEHPDALEDVIIGGDSTRGGESDVSDDYFKPIYSKPAHYRSMQNTNLEARDTTGMEDDLGYVASMMRDNSAETRRKKLRDDSGTLTNIFG